MEREGGRWRGEGRGLGWVFGTEVWELGDMRGESEKRAAQVVASPPFNRKRKRHPIYTSATHRPPPTLATGHIGRERCRADDGMGGGVADVRVRRRGRVRKRVFWGDWRVRRRGSGGGRRLFS
jgi:hypothetical protein